ncbi:hypothetical protein ACQRIT_004108 [Beauveria bassiana]
MNTFQKRLLEEFSGIRDLLETNTDVSYNAFAAVFQGLIDSAKRSFDAQAAKAAEVAAIPEAFKTLETENTKLKELLGAAQTRLDAGEIRLEASLNLLKADQKQLNIDQERLEAGQARLDAAQTRLNAGEIRLEAILNLLKADQQQLNVD